MYTEKNGIDLLQDLRGDSRRSNLSTVVWVIILLVILTMLLMIMHSSLGVP